MISTRRSNDSIGPDRPIGLLESISTLSLPQKDSSLVRDGLSSPPTNRPYKRRATSISIDAANKYGSTTSRFQDLSLYTPTSRTSYDDAVPTEFICLCTRAPKVPRPRNAFILYRQHYQAQVAAQHPGLANPEISKLIGEQWRDQSEEVKSSWRRLAEEEKARHQRQYPDYRYQPRRGPKGGPGSRPGTSADDTGRCLKCGGRSIATPRAPLTPHTPAFSRSDPNAIYPMIPDFIDPNPRVIETDHLKRGPAAGHLVANTLGRRPIQPDLQSVPDGHAMWPSTASPDAKRRRYHGAFHIDKEYVLPSPPLNQISYTVEPRYQQRLSVSRPSASAAYASSGPNSTGTQQFPHQQQQGPELQQMGGNVVVCMQPPPRPDICYQNGGILTPVTTSRSGPGFDESLRLPPLHIQVPNSPNLSSNTSTVSSENTVGGPNQDGQGFIDPRLQPMSQSQLQHQGQYQRAQTPSYPRWQFLVRLNMLRAISPPLMPPGPGAPKYETRGPIIAIEGLPTRVLEDVTAVIEKALSVSGECVVKLWADSGLTLPNRGLETNAVTRKQASPDYKAIQTSDDSEVVNPLARYMMRMLKWHRVSEDLVKYITHHPELGTKLSAEETVSSSQLECSITTSRSSAPSPGPAPESNSNASGSATNLRPKLPVAVLSTGYSLTASDLWAAALPTNDAYHSDDHWRWVAALWRGIVGPDLTVYVKQNGDEERISPGSQLNESSVEFGGPGVLVVRIPENVVHAIDEKLERRLGFEIMEWVRSRGFGTRD